MGLKPNEQNEEQAPGEGSNRAARLGFIVLVQVHYWQGQSACDEATLRNFVAEKRGAKRRPFGRRDGTNRGQLGEHQGSKMAGLSPSPSQASSSTRPRQGTPSNLATTSSIPHATTATAAAGKTPRYPEPDATAPGGGEKTPPTRAQGCGTAALAWPLRRVTRSTSAAVACGMPYRGPIAAESTDD
jgi:hypothetical protein